MLLKTKDYFTLGNVLGGFFCVIFVIQGKLEWASYSILIAYAFDVSDGLVARITKQFNKFGAELDNVADLVAYSIAPSFLIYGYYTMHPFFPHLPWVLAAAVGSLPTLAGCIRFARFNVKRIHYEGAWFGFPRPASALLFIGYFNMHVTNTPGSMDIFGISAPYELFYWAGIPLVIYSSAMHFVLVPFINHHQKEMPLYLKVAIFFIFSSIFLASLGHLITGFGVTWEIITWWLFCYLVGHRYFCFTPKEREDIAAYIKEWKKGEGEI